MSRHFKSDVLLTARDRRAFRALAARPSATIDSLLAWARKRGYQVGRTAVCNYMRRVRLLEGLGSDQELYRVLETSGLLRQLRIAVEELRAVRYEVWRMVRDPKFIRRLARECGSWGRPPAADAPEKVPASWMEVKDAAALIGRSAGHLRRLCLRKPRVKADGLAVMAHPRRGGKRRWYVSPAFLEEFPALADPPLAAPAPR